MAHPLEDLIDARIRAAQADGAFDDLPGQGKPLPKEDANADGVLNGILKRNGAVPPAVAISQEMARLREELSDAKDRTRRKELITEISYLQARFDLLRKRG